MHLSRTNAVASCLRAACSCFIACCLPLMAAEDNTASAPSDDGYTWDDSSERFLRGADDTDGRHDDVARDTKEEEDGFWGWWDYDYFTSSYNDYEYEYDYTYEAWQEDDNDVAEQARDDDGEGEWDWYGWDDEGEDGFWDW